MIKRYSQNQINEIADILKKDGIISVPTDTVFGICARIDSKIAYDKLMAAKNRSKDKSLPVMCMDKEQIKSIAVINENAEKLIQAFMPGPITLVLNKKNSVPYYVTNGKNTIAVRMATSKVLENIIRKIGSPIFMTSANQSGEPTCTTLDEIEKSCPNLDGMVEGHVFYSKGSTIVDCSSKNIEILRVGPISIEEINNAYRR